MTSSALFSTSPPADVDVVVIGAGHAGCEAALAAARAGCTVLVLTPNLDRVGFMPCNPSIGGPGKSHIVAEVDALGGEMARAADRAMLQIRCLNTSKGPAVRAIRAQADKALYALAMKEALERQTGVRLLQDEAVGLITEPAREAPLKVSGIATRSLGLVRARAVVVTAGTFLRGALISGESRVTGGRAGDRADLDLAGSISASGFVTRRLKTGTPPRIDARTVDFTLAELQAGSVEPLWLSRDGARGRLELLALPPDAPHACYATDGWRLQLACFRISTNPSTHDVIRANLHRAPMFNGSIRGTGPRYCPSVEDKVARFGEKQAHPVFLEPEGWRSGELYVQGFSTSLPPDVQEQAIRTMPALRHAVITRFGYAVEYDAVDPSELTSTLQARRIAGLFFAGQINGTSGYEEAAGQGIVAGINAAATVQGRSQLVLRRDQAYIGVMIDDLVTKPFDEPYRMLTARAEFRLSLRPSTADRRLAAIGRDRNLISGARAAEIDDEMETVEAWIERLRTLSFTPSLENRDRLQRAGIEPPGRDLSALDLLRRPDVDLGGLANALGEELWLIWDVSPTLRNLVEEEAKYSAFIERERREVERQALLEQRVLPQNLDYCAVAGLRIEASTKLTRQRPRTIGEASRMMGVTPADIAALLIHTARSEALPS